MPGESDGGAENDKKNVDNKVKYFHKTSPFKALKAHRWSGSINHPKDMKYTVQSNKLSPRPSPVFDKIIAAFGLA